MNVEPCAEKTQRGEIQRRGQRHAKAEQCEPRIEKQPSRAEEKQQAKMPPAIAPAAQMRRTATPVGMKRSRHFGDSPSGERCLHHELARELHSGGAEVQRADRFAIEGAQAAVEIAHPDAKQQSAD